MVYINVDRLTPPFKKNLQKSNTAEPRCVEVQGTNKFISKYANENQ
jgi:hypothetical protein